MEAAKAERWIFASDNSFRIVIRAILRSALADATSAPWIPLPKTAAGWKARALNALAELSQEDRARVFEAVE